MNYVSGAVPVAVTAKATCEPEQTGIVDGLAVMLEIAGGLSTIKVNVLALSIRADSVAYHAIKTSRVRD